MEPDLLLKEDEFYKENEKLELKTKQLMQKVNDVMKIQDHLIKDTFKTQVEISEARKSNYKFTKSSASEQVLFENDLQPEENKEGETGNSNGLVRIYRAKLKGVYAEKERVQIELKLKNEEVKKLQKVNQQLKEEKEKWFLLYNTGKNNIGKLETQLTNMNAKLQSKDTENACLKKEVEQLKKELKTTNMNLNNSDVRLTRVSEEAEKLKAILKQSKEDEKDFKEGYRKQLNELTATIKHLEKQKLELLNGFKKQMQLIDVLRKQKMHLEAFKIGEMTEAEYLRILDWKFE